MPTAKGSISMGRHSDCVSILEKVSHAAEALVVPEKNVTYSVGMMPHQTCDLRPTPGQVSSVRGRAYLQKAWTPRPNDL